MNKSNKIESKNIRDILALTPMQEGMLFHYLQAPRDSSYFNQLDLEVTGDINPRYFEAAWNFVIETNEMLRTVFRWEKLETPTQVVLKRHTLHLRYEDLSSVGDCVEQKKQWETVKQQDRSSQFDLRQVPFRVILGKMSQNRYQMLISNHHILYDGWSTGIILKEFFQAYETLAMGSLPPVPRVKPGFKEFIQWHQEQDRLEQKKFWQNYLEGFDTPSRLPIKRSKPSPGFPGVRNYRLHLSQTVKDKLEVFVSEKRITLAAVFYCAWGMLLQKYCGMEDVVFGTIVSGRSTPIQGIENMVGLFINTVPLRARLEPGEALLDFLVGINRHLAASERYENTPLVDIYRCCRQSTQVGEELFDTIVSMENYPLDTYLREPGSHLSIQSYSMEEMPHYDLTLVISAAEGIDIDFIYNNTSFDKETVVRLAHHFSTILKGIGENVENRPQEIELVSEKEKHRLLFDFNRTAAAYPKEKTICRLFEEQVEHRPHQVALVGPKLQNTKYKLQTKYKIQITNHKQSGALRADVDAFGEIQLSYGLLNEESNRLAEWLIEKGVKSDTIVGILMERSIDMVIGILGILKSGGAYLPIAPDYPQERIDSMLKDSNAKILVTAPGLSEKLEKLLIVNCRLLIVNEIPPNRRRLNNPPQGTNSISNYRLTINHLQLEQAHLAYIIYTSGSTGKPRGVMVEHGPVVNLLFALHHRYPLREQDTYLLKTSYLFDVSVTELFGWFLEGGRLAVLEPGGEKDPKAILEMIAREGVTHINFVPSMFHTFVEILEPREIAKLHGLKYIFLAGEALLPGPVNRFRRLNAAIAIENIYGPTEAAVYASWYSLADWKGEASIPIGKPLPNVTLYIVDKWGYLQPIGVPGELYIGGEGLARGYLNNPGLSFEKFCLRRPGALFEKTAPVRETSAKDFLTSGSDKDHMQSCNHATMPLATQHSHHSTTHHSPLTIYHTGDLARWLLDGNVEFLGRMDFQVKVRGFRIELGEIENRLLNYPSVKETVVTAQAGRSGDHFICAYVVPFLEKPFEISQLKDYLRQKLPDYMIPAYFVTLEAMILTSTGKIDRKSLPKPEVKSTKKYVRPGDELEIAVVNIWSEILGIDGGLIGIDDNFFELGGHSLKITAFLGRIYKELKIEVPFSQVFIRPTVRELAAYIRRQEKTQYNEIPLVEEKEYYSLSSAQKRLYVLQQMDVSSIVYNIHGFMMLEGDVDKEKPEKVFQGLIVRHKSLRTSFHMVDNEPVQRIRREVEFRIEYFDAHEFHGLDKGGYNKKFFGGSRGAILQKSPPGRRRQDFIRPFNLSEAPLLRVGFSQLEEDKFILMVDMHHIISDGFSLGIFIKEFMAIYQGKNLPALRLRYKDFSQWHNARRESEALRGQESYWLRQFKGEIPVLNLPIDFPRPVVQVFEGAHTGFWVGKEDTTALQTIALEENTTLFGVLVSVFTIFLSRLSGQEDIIIGTPVTGRKHNDLPGVIGMFVNMLVLRNFPAGGQTFLELLKETGTRILEALENREYPFEDLVERLTLNRDASRNPLFDAAFALQDPDMPRLEIPGLKVTPYEYDIRISKFDLTLIAGQVGDQLHFTVQYCTKLFKAETIERFIGYFKQLVSSIVENPGQKISTLDILSRQEKQRLAVEFNAIGTHYPNDKTIPGLFAEQVKKTPDHTALYGCMIAWMHGEEGVITYKELNENSERLAHLLIEKGIQPGSIVGIILERSIEMIIGILGILKTGSAYLPIDPGSPVERIDYMLKDSNAKLVVNQKFFGGSRGVVFQKSPPGRRRLNIPPQETDLFYIIYTSGSSGKPKGVPITYANFSPLIHWGYRHLGIGPKDRVLQNLSYYFDWSVWEIFIALTTGASLYMVTREVIMNPGKCIEFIRTHALTVLHITPTHYSYLVNTGKVMETLRYLFIGAEKLTYDLVKRSIEAVSPGCRIFNMYGPTEATIISAVLEIDRSWVDEYKELSSVPIGKPSGNTYLLVLDHYLNLCPVKVAGELYIGGDGIALGYLNNPELTFEKFCLSPLTSHHTPLYQTGDLARWLPDGNVEFLGRIDHQVKIRGYRVELGEIENHLLDYPGIKEAVVLVKENPAREKHLCAYIVAGEDFDRSKLKNTLAGFLPDYMIPSYFILMEKMPLNPNKKIDLKALPGPELTAGQDYTAPGNEVEKKLVNIWSSILDLERDLIGVDADFFRLGGHSLKATLLAARIEKELQVKVPLPEIFITPTIRGLAEFIAHGEEFRFQSIEPVEKKEYYPLSSAQKRFYVLQKMNITNTSFNFSIIMVLEGELNKKRFEETFWKLLNWNESFRTSFKEIEDTPVQIIDVSVVPGIEYYSLEIKVEEPEMTQSITRLIANFIRPFYLDHAPLIRVGLIKEENKKHILMIDVHHIIVDGLALEILCSKFFKLYSGEEFPLLRLQFKDFSAWQNSEKEKTRMKTQEDYWLKIFGGNIPVLNLPIDYARLEVQSFEGDFVKFEIGSEETNFLKNLAEEEKTTLYILFLAICNIWLSKICNQEAIVIGTGAACRRHPDIQHMIGCFQNMLAIINYPEVEKTFMEFLKEVKERAVAAFENQEYPFEELVKKITLKREQGRNPLFDVFYLLQKAQVQSTGTLEAGIQELKVRPYNHQTRTTRFDLGLYGIDRGGSLYFNLEYCTRLFKGDTIKELVRYFKDIIHAVKDNKNVKLKDIKISHNLFTTKGNFASDDYVDFNF